MSTKPGQLQATNESIALFGNREAGGLVLLKTYRDYYDGYQDGDRQVRGYADLVEELLEKYPVGAYIVGEQSQRDFIKLYGTILRVWNILTAFGEFKGNEILSPRDQQDYHSMYIDLYDDFRSSGDGESANINDDLVFEMELIKQIEINIDYILELVKKYQEGHRKDREVLVDIEKAVDSSIELRNKKDLIQRFIASLEDHSDVDRDWQRFVEERKTEELEQIISSENVDRDATFRFMRNAFRDGGVPTTGTALSTILPPGGRFSPSGERTKKRERILAKLTTFFDRFFGISSNEDSIESQADREFDVTE